MARRVTVRRSPIHGRGLFAATDIAAGEEVAEYRGEVIGWDEAMRRYEDGLTEAGHTFLFDIGDGLVIDGRRRGTVARWINHGCEPNCAAEVIGRKVVVTATRDIASGEELLLDYQLQLEDTPSEEDAAAYACGCGAASCRSTMLGA